MKEQALPTSQGISITGEALGRMNGEERIFLESLHDLERRLAGGTSYDLLMASGIVQKMLLDETPNRRDVRARAWERRLKKGGANDRDRGAIASCCQSATT